MAAPTTEVSRISANGSDARRDAAIDIVLYLAAALLLLGIEYGLDSVGLLPWADLSRGAFTLVGSLLVVIALQRRHHQGLRDLGFRRPEHWWTIPAWAVAVLIVSIALQLTVTSALGQLFNAPEPDYSRYDAIEGNVPLYLVTLLGAMFTGGFIEEVIYRGLLIDRLSRLLGTGRASAAGAALLSGLTFGLIHFQWGLGGIVSTASLGAGLSFMFLATRRNLWPLVAAHATLDFILITLLYLGAAE